MHKTLTAVETKYEDLRVAARKEAEEQLGIPHLRLVGVTGIHAHIADTWKLHPKPYREPATWPWTKLWAEYRHRYVKNFNVSLLFAGNLCGLAIGRPTRHKAGLRLDFIEGSPAADQPLRGRVVPIVLACGEVYARAIGASQVRIMRPLPKLVDYYASMGYHFVPAGAKLREHAYLWKNLSDG